MKIHYKNQQMDDFKEIAQQSYWSEKAGEFVTKTQLQLDEEDYMDELDEEEKGSASGEGSDCDVKT